MWDFMLYYSLYFGMSPSGKALGFGLAFGVRSACGTSQGNFSDLELVSSMNIPGSRNVTRIRYSINSSACFSWLTLGCRQVVRHQVLVLAFGGSNPSIPAKRSMLNTVIPPSQPRKIESVGLVFRLCDDYALTVGSCSVFGLRLKKLLTAPAIAAVPSAAIVTPATFGSSSSSGAALAPI